MKIPRLPEPGSTTGDFSPPEVEAARQIPVRRPMSVGANTDRFLPSWIGSIRFRLALLYSVLLFGLAAILLGGLYWGLARELSQTVLYDGSVDDIVRGAEGDPMFEQLEVFEAEVDRQALADLRRYSFSALALLFIASLGVGWYVAGLVLRPLDRVISVARSITATDLTRRINLSGPDDELGQLADTFDDMLDRLDMAFTAQTRFIHEASHELRNPLAVIRTNLDVALADPDASAEDLRRTGQVVSRASERMSTLVDDLLDHARQETSAKQVEIVDVAAVVRGTGEEFEVPADADGVRLVIDTEDDLLVEGDPVSLRRALANLVANAIRLAPEDTTISLRAGRIEEWVWMGVQDQGPGIAPGDQQRVFRRFWRGDDTKVPRKDGRSGLGLAIVKKIAETHGGTVRVESELGQGATFVVWLPSAAALGASLAPDEVEWPEAHKTEPSDLLTGPLHAAE